MRPAQARPEGARPSEDVGDMIPETREEPTPFELPLADAQAAPGLGGAELGGVGAGGPRNEGDGGAGPSGPAAARERKPLVIRGSAGNARPEASPSGRVGDTRSRPHSPDGPASGGPGRRTRSRLALPCGAAGSVRLTGGPCPVDQGTWPPAVTASSLSALPGRLRAPAAGPWLRRRTGGAGGAGGPSPLSSLKSRTDPLQGAPQERPFQVQSALARGPGAPGGGGAPPGHQREPLFPKITFMGLLCSRPRRPGRGTASPSACNHTRPRVSLRAPVLPRTCSCCHENCL